MSKSERYFQVILHIVMILISLICLFPFLLMVASSVTEETSLIINGYSLFPKKFSLDAYRYLMTSSTSIVRGYVITILVTLVGTTMNMLLTILLAYPLSRPELPHKNIFSFLIFFTMLFNGGLVPSYMMWTQVFHIKNTYLALIVPALMMNAFYVIMMRTYFTSNIPNEVLESARIDGAGELKILVRIVLPMSLPIMATVGLMVGLSYWNDWINGLYYVNKPQYYSIQNILNRMLQDVQFLSSSAGAERAADMTMKMPTTSIRMALSVIGILPIMVIYPFIQKFLVKGITVGAVKG